MDAELIEQKVYFLLAKKIRKKGLKPNLKMTESIIKSGLIDSLGALELVAEIEEAFNISVLPDEMTEANFESISQIRDFIKNKLNG
jgi:acyl carrier protein